MTHPNKEHTCRRAPESKKGVAYETGADRLGYFQLWRFDRQSADAYDPIFHYHNTVEIIFVMSGECMVYVGGESRVLRAGEIAFVDSLTPHRTGKWGDGEADAYVLMISDRYFSKIIGRENVVFSSFLPAHEGFAHVARILDAGYDALPLMNEDMREGFCAYLLGLMKAVYPIVSKQKSSNREAMARVLEYMNEHYSEDITLGLLSKIVGYEVSYLSKSFNATFGVSLRSYLNRLRISKVVMIQKSDPRTPLYKVAEACGFKSQNTFYRAYNRYGKEFF